MSQDKKKREEEPVPADESPPVDETPTVEEPSKNAKAKAAPAKSGIRLVLTGAGSYSNMVLDVGPFRKGKPFEVDEALADALLATRLFERA